MQGEQGLVCSPNKDGAGAYKAPALIPYYGLVSNPYAVNIRRVVKSMKTAAALLVLSILSTVSSAEDFLGDQVDTLMVLIEEHGPQNVMDYIEEFEPVQRLQLYDLTRELYIFREWEGRNIDDYITVMDSGIEEALSQANNASDSFTITVFLDMANAMSYNLSADLAECWPGDTLTRHRSHFERGLSAALQCIEWRHELDKGPYPFFMAYWAAGIHQLSLDRPREAIYSFVKSLNNAQQLTIDAGRPLGVTPEVGFELLLAHGYLGLAMQVCGEDEGEQYENAIHAFREGIDYSEWSDDYSFGIAQLMWARDRIMEEQE